MSDGYFNRLHECPEQILAGRPREGIRNLCKRVEQQKLNRSSKLPE